MRRIRSREEMPAFQRPSLDSEPRTWSTSLSIIGALSISGLCRGMFGVAGPPMMVLLMFFPIDRSVWRCIAASNRVTAVIVQGATLGLNADLSPSCWPMYLMLMLGGLTGIALGNKAASYVDAAAFEDGMLLFLGSGALLMLCTGHRTLSAVAAILIFVAVVTVSLRVAIKSARRVRASGACANTDHRLHDLRDPNLGEALSTSATRT